MSISTHIIDITGGTVHTVDSLLAAAVPSGASLVSSLNTQLGGTVWQTHPTDAAIVSAINAHLGGTTWQSGGSGTPTFGSLTGAVADNAALVAEFAGKSDTGHTHTLEDITDIIVTADTITFTQGVRPGLYDDLDEPPVGTIFRGSNDGHLYFCHDDGSVHLLCDSGGYGGTIYWGDIEGSLVDQTDLQTALDARQPLDAELTAIAGLASAANTAIYFTGSGTAALMVVTSAARSLLDDTTAGAMRGTLGAQEQSATLDLIAGLSPATDRYVYFTGASSAALGTITTAGRALLDDANAAAQRSTLGLVIGVNVQAQNQSLANIAQTIPAANTIAYNDTPLTGAITDLTSIGRSLIGAATDNSARSVIGACIANNSTTALAGLTPAADRVPYYTGSGTAALATLTSAARNLLDDVDDVAMRTTIGVIGASDTVRISGAQTISGAKTFSAALTASGALICNGVLRVGVFTFATVPDPVANVGATIRISDRSHRLATTDGTNWNWAGTTTPIS
jgi:hypothetical protein